MDTNLEEKIATKELERGYSKAEKLLQDEDKFERFLQRLEKKLEVIPGVGSKLAEVPIMASLVKNYVKKEYTDIPIGSVIAIVSALIYFVSPIDLVPDSIPGIGYVDDVAVIGLCLKLVEADVKEYKKWREDNVKEIVDGADE